MNNTLTDSRPVFFHLITGFGVGGAERMLSRVVPRLVKYRHVVISLRRDGPMREVYEQSGLTTAALQMRHPLDLRAWLRFRRLIHQHHPTVLTTYLIHADVAGRILGHFFGIPIIVSSLRARFRKFEVRNLLRLAKLFDGFVTSYIAVSEEVRRFYVDDLHFPAKKFTVVTNGLPVDEWHTEITTDIRGRLLRNLGLPESSRLVGTVSQLRPEKGVDRLIHAMAKLDNSSLHCLLIGDGPEQARLESLVATNGLQERVHFLGNRPDVADVLLLLDIFVLPSHFEGMSNALLEAMASGRAIIVTDTSENREVITPATGRLIDTANAALLANTMKELLTNKNINSQLGRAARQRFEQHFSLDRKIEQLDRIYADLLHSV